MKGVLTHDGLWNRHRNDEQRRAGWRKERAAVRHLIETEADEPPSGRRSAGKGVPKKKRWTPAELAAARPWAALLPAFLRTYSKRFETEEAARRFAAREARLRQIRWTVEYRPTPLEE